jgi:outer membrane immunogenic protein
MTRHLSLTVVALGFLGTAAWADGMVEPAAAPCCEAPFAGAYIGAAIGYGQQRVEVTNLDPGAPSSGQTFADDEGAFTFGGYIGYNWQHCCSHVVFGIEADFNYLDGSPTAFDRQPPGLGGFPDTTSLDSTINWFGTLRGRAGFVVHDHLLLYATGGLAYANVDHTLRNNCVGCGDLVFAVTPADFGAFTQSDDQTKVGWTLGGGAELLHDTRWVLRAEALYVDLGSETHHYVVNPLPGNPGGFVTPATSTARWEDEFWVARIGVAYKFHSPDCCAAPLK